jgi:hypothetical protein
MPYQVLMVYAVALVLALCGLRLKKLIVQALPAEKSSRPLALSGNPMGFGALRFDPAKRRAHWRR